MTTKPQLAEKIIEFENMAYIKLFMNEFPIIFRGGFSLIELLVVVSVVALLAAILMPAISLVRVSAKSAHCRSNLKQIGLTFSSYAADFEGRLPPVRFWDPNLRWTNNLGDYLEKVGAGVGDVGIRGNGFLPCPGFADSSNTLSYAYNAHLGDPPWAWASLNNNFYSGDWWSRSYFFTEGNVSRISQRALVLDGIDWSAGDYQRYLAGHLSPVADGRGGLRHRGQINAVFCDYHVAGAETATMRWALDDPSKF